MTWCQKMLGVTAPQWSLVRVSSGQHGQHCCIPQTNTPPPFLFLQIEKFSHKVHNLTRNYQVSGDPCLLYIRPVAGEVEIDGAQPGSTACGFPEWGGAGGGDHPLLRALVRNSSPTVLKSFVTHILHSCEVTFYPCSCNRPSLTFP